MQQTNETKLQEKDSFWIGRCPVKGCACRIRITVPMIGRIERVRNRLQDYNVTRWYPKDGSMFSCWSLGLHCSAHRRPLSWKAVNGKVSQTHICDARCLNAIGADCECSCGGVNHGKAHDCKTIFKFNLE